MSRLPRRLAAVSLAAACAVAIAPAAATAAKPKAPATRTLGACLNQTSGKVRIAGRGGCQPLVEQRVAMRVVPRGKAGAKKQGVTNGIVVCVGKYYGAIRAEKDGCSSAETRMVISIIGPKGPAGATGPAGSDGANGANGRDGATGPAGPAGGSGGGTVPSGAVPGMTEINGYLVGPNANLMLAQLPGADLSGMDLRQVNFIGANLKAAHLSHSNLRGAIFGRDVSSYTDTDLTNADLSGSVLTNGYMSSSMHAEHANFDGAVFTGLHGSFPSAFTTSDAWSAVSLRGTDFRDMQWGPSNLGAVDASNALFAGFRNCGASFVGTNLTGAQLAGLEYRSNQLGRIDANCRLTGTGIVGTPASLPDGVRDIGGNLLGPQTNLAAAFLDADLHGMDLSNSMLSGSFARADLTGANLSGVIASGSMRDALLAGATVVGAHLCPGSTPASFPTDWKRKGQCLVGPGAMLDGSSDLGTDSLADVSMTGVHSVGYTTWSGSGLPAGVVFRGGAFFGPGISNREAWTSGADLHDFDMRTPTDLHGAAFYQANLRGTTWGAANTGGDNGDRWNFGLLSADLTGASFAGVDLGTASKVEVQASDFTNATLSDSRLHLVCSSWNANTYCGDFTGAHAERSVWEPITGFAPPIWPWNFSGAHLNGATFSGGGAAYYGTPGNRTNPLNFAGADLTNATFSQSNLSGTVGLDSAILTGVTWTNVTCPDGDLSTAHGNTCAGHLVP